MGIVMGILLLLLGVFALIYVPHPTIAPHVVASPLPAALEDSTPLLGGFSETGTLIFYPNNVEPVPYLFYQDSKGTTVAKALVFPETSPFYFSSWVGSRVVVTGTVELEHVLVRTIVHLAAP